MSAKKVHVQHQSVSRSTAIELRALASEWSNVEVSPFVRRATPRSEAIKLLTAREFRRHLLRSDAAFLEHKEACCALRPATQKDAGPGQHDQGVLRCVQGERLVRPYRPRFEIMGGQGLNSRSRSGRGFVYACLFSTAIWITLYFVIKEIIA